MAAASRSTVGGHPPKTAGGDSRSLTNWTK